MKNEKRERSEIIDVTKGIAIITVVLGHCIQYGMGRGYFQSNLYFENSIFKFIYSFHMPLFMIISGYLFEFSIKKYSFKNNIKNRFLTLIIPIFTWGFIIACIKSINNNMGVIEFVKMYISTSIYNLWFLWAIFYCSIVVLLVRNMFKDNVLIYVLGFIITFIVPDILGSATYKFMYPFFILGYFISKYKDKIKSISKRSKDIFIGINLILYCCLLILYNYNSYIYTSGYYIFNNNNTMVQVLTNIYRIIIGITGCVVIFALIKTIYNRQYTKINRIISKIGQLSLGIYIISGYIFIYILPKLTVNITGINYILVIIETIIIISVSILITKVLQKLKVANKFLLGGR